MLERVIGDHITLRWAAPEGVCAVWADPTQLEQVVLNLAVNARDAMPDGGTLSIEATDVQLGDEYCVSHARAEPGAYVRLSVTDTGSGMSAAVRERIFEPFFTTKGPIRGTGLGLATVFGIVEQSSGWIDVRSEPGAGTTFELHFPLHAGEVAGDAAIPSTHPVGGTETVLLLDDDPLVRQSAARLLARCGYEVLAAGSGEEAVRLATSHEGRIDLLLSDVVMPGLAGPEVARRVVGLRPGIKVLFVSGFSEAVDFGDDVHFLSKPYSLESLSRRLRELLDVQLLDARG